MNRCTAGSRTVCTWAAASSAQAQPWCTSPPQRCTATAGITGGEVRRSAATVRALPICRCNRNTAAGTGDTARPCSIDPPVRAETRSSDRASLAWTCDSGTPATSGRGRGDVPDQGQVLAELAFQAQPAELAVFPGHRADQV